MKKLVITMATLGALAGGGLLTLAGKPTTDGNLTERWIDVNHLQVKAHGRWQDVPMVPLSAYTCDSGHPAVNRYCP